MNSFFKSKWFYLIVGTWLVIAIFVVVAFSNRVAGKRIIFVRPDYKEYPLLDLYENVYKPIYGVVEEVDVYSGISYVSLTNGTKFSIDKRTENFECSPSQLSYLIQVGDSIAKPEEDFLFFVHRNKICYPFKIRERLRALPVDMSMRGK